MDSSWTSSPDLQLDPSAEGFININVDAGISTEHNVGTTADVCRDRDGTYMDSSMLGFFLGKDFITQNEA